MISLAIALVVFILAIINVNVFGLSDPLLYGISIGLAVGVLIHRVFGS